MAKTEVVCLGELLVDMFPAQSGKRLEEVTAFQPKPGGAPANVAVSLARLGIKSAFVGKVGQDAFGHSLASVLIREGVSTSGLRFDDEARTTLAFIAKPDPDTSEFLFYRNPGADTRLNADELDRTLLSGTQFLHFGSLSLVEDPIRSAALEAIRIVKIHGARVSMDVNYRPTLWGGPGRAFDGVTAVLGDIDLLKVNEDELALLSGTSDPEEGSKRIMNYGPQICVVTLGARGSFFRTKQGYGFAPVFDVETVDATGCGDAFVAGLLSRLVRGDSWPNQLLPATMYKNLIFANAVGALTARSVGTIPALPTAEAVQEFLKNRPEWKDANG